MKRSRRASSSPAPTYLLPALLVLLALPAFGQSPPSSIDDDHRLFQLFSRDAAIVPNAWLEARAVLSGLERADDYLLGTVLAFRPADDWEVGTEFGFRLVDPDAGSSESGLSDLDLFVKRRVLRRPFDVSVGGVLKLPTGEEEEGLGTGETDAEAFVALRHYADNIAFVAHAAARFNGDPDLGEGSPDGQVSARLGLGALFAANDRIGFSLGLDLESERFEDSGEDIRFTAGVDYRTTRRLGIRTAIAAGLSDDAPDVQIFGGVVYRY